MAHVVGIPSLKGNSQEIIGAKMSEKNAAGWLDTAFEGEAVALVRSAGNDVTVTKMSVDPASFYGFIMDINRCAGTCSVVARGRAVTLPTADWLAFAAQDPVTINTATGLIDAAGDAVVSGRIVNTTANASNGVNGKTGATIPNCVMVDLDGIGLTVPVTP